MNDTHAENPPAGALWPDRYLTDGELVIRRGERARVGLLRRSVRWCGRTWRALRPWQQWLLALAGAVAVAAPFTAVSQDVAGVVGVVVLAGIGALAYRFRDEPHPPTSLTPEAVLALSDTTEARVAGAAGRAWAETVAEPSWGSPYLAGTRAAFDGQARVDEIIDLALRLHATRLHLGSRPDGAAAEYWDRQHEALEQAARRLGERADALIRYRDQAALLSTELHHLADLERLERTAVEIDGLAVETAHDSTRSDGGIGSVADEIEGVRRGMSELVDLMTRTRTPLAEPPQPLP